MQPPFDDNLKEIADSMGVALSLRFTLNEACLFLRCPASDLQHLVGQKEVLYIPVSQTEIQLLGYQLFQHLLNNVTGNLPQTPAKQSNDTQDRILRAHKVQHIVGVSRSTIWRMERKGQFPARLPMGTDNIGWLKSDIEAWIINHRQNRYNPTSTP